MFLFYFKAQNQGFSPFSKAMETKKFDYDIGDPNFSWNKYTKEPYDRQSSPYVATIFNFIPCKLPLQKSLAHCKETADVDAKDLGGFKHEDIFMDLFKLNNPTVEIVSTTVGPTTATSTTSGGDTIDTTNTFFLIFFEPCISKNIQYTEKMVVYEKKLKFYISSCIHY